MKTHSLSKINSNLKTNVLQKSKQFQKLFHHLFISLLFLLLLLPTSYQARTITVCKGCSLDSLKHAIQIANHGDKIQIKIGTYKEGFLPITKSITIQGETGVTIDGLKEKHVFGIYHDHVQISNLKITGSGISDLVEYAGIYTEKVKDCHFENLELEDNVYGFYLSETNHCTIKNMGYNGSYNMVYNGPSYHI